MRPAGTASGIDLERAAAVAIEREKNVWLPARHLGRRTGCRFAPKPGTDRGGWGRLPVHVDRVAKRLPAFAASLATVAPAPFLDDTTTKNVLVDGGRLSGILDIDRICVGEPLLTEAPTPMALLARGFDTPYVEHWANALDPSADRRALLGLYTALFCVAFLGDFGQRFNRQSAPAFSPIAVERLLGILDQLLAAT